LGPGAILGIVASAVAAGLVAAAVVARKARARRRRHRQQGRSSAPPGPDDGEYRDEGDEAPCLGSGRPARSDDAAPPPKPSATGSMLWPPHPSEADADAAPDFRPRRAAALASSNRLGEI
jgi:hypothetical protein